ncbi:ice-structuring glycoprotein-like [Drosophila tropicalis]|uniref:ice-structuring glycoprotein-like n=1 Tax=Drosophila tropicalis TaxID=46794 RepID=UPI0035AB91F2
MTTRKDTYFGTRQATRSTSKVAASTPAAGTDSTAMSTTVPAAAVPVAIVPAAATDSTAMSTTVPAAAVPVAIAPSADVVPTAVPAAAVHVGAVPTTAVPAAAAAVHVAAAATAVPAAAAALQQQILKLQQNMDEVQAPRQQVSDLSVIESMVARFSADTAYGVKKWLNDLEDAFEILQLNDRLQVYNALRSRRIKAGEGCLRFAIEMKEIAMNAPIPENELVDMIIDGLRDNSTRVGMLYSARTVAELKPLLERYERFRMQAAASKQSLSVKVQPTTTASSPCNKSSGTAISETRCYNCSGWVHYKSQCPKPIRPPNSCFKCGIVGHIYKNCLSRMETAAAAPDDVGDRLKHLQLATRSTSKVAAFTPAAGTDSTAMSTTVPAAAEQVAIAAAASTAAPAAAAPAASTAVPVAVSTAVPAASTAVPTACVEEVYNALRSRRIKAGEGCLRFAVEMKEIAMNAPIPENELVDMIIDGLRDNSTRVGMLYSARTVAELKPLLERYERFRMQAAASKQSFSVKVQPTTTASSPGNKSSGTAISETRCFNCSGWVHYKSQCPKPIRPPNSCFKCGIVGHIYKNCLSRMETAAAAPDDVGDRLKHLQLKINLQLRSGMTTRKDTYFGTRQATRSTSKVAASTPAAGTDSTAMSTTPPQPLLYPSHPLLYPPHHPVPAAAAPATAASNALPAAALLAAVPASITPAASAYPSLDEQLTTLRKQHELLQLQQQILKLQQDSKSVT